MTDKNSPTHVKQDGHVGKLNVQTVYNNYWKQTMDQ